MDKQKREEEWSRERAQLEMENAQLKMQLAKESMSVGVKKGAGARSPDNEEVVAKLKKTLHTKGCQKFRIILNFLCKLLWNLKNKHFSLEISTLKLLLSLP